MQQPRFHFHRAPLFGLVLVTLSSACPAEDDGDDEGAGSDTGSASDSSATDPTNATAMTAPADDGVDDEGATLPGEDEGIDTGADDGTDDGADTGADDGTDDGADTGAESDDGATTGAAGVTVSGTVRRTEAAYIQGGNDGIGTLYLGVLVECTQDSASVTGYSVMDIDVSSTASTPAWEIPDVPDGTYYIAAFLDDNGNADRMNPNADMGDLAASEGFGPGCLEVNVSGADVAAGEIQLDITVPF